MSSSAGAAANLTETLRQAEELWRQGELEPAFERYRNALGAILRGGRAVDASGLVALERFADLAVLVNRFEAAADSLRAMSDLCASGGNAYGADYAALKSISALHQGGDLKRALELLYSLARFGNIDAIEFKEDALAEWEALVRWPETDAEDRAVIFALFYLTSSRLLASMGQFQDARAAAHRGRVHSERKTALARRYRVPLLLAEATATIESGALEPAARLLAEAEALIDPKRDPGFSFECRELAAKLAMLRGNLSDALKYFTSCVQTARDLKAARSLAICLSNLAHFEILINQTISATTHLEEAATLVGDETILGRIARLRSLAELRARSYAGDLSESVTEMWAPESSTGGAASVLESESTADQAADYLAWFEQRALDFQLALGNRQLELASQMFLAMHRVFGATDSELVRLRMAVLDAMLAYYTSDLPRASEILKFALPLLEQAGLRHDLWQARRMAVWVAKRSGASAEQIEAAVAKESAILDALASSLDPASRAIFLLNKWTAEEEHIAALAAAAEVYQNRPRAGFVFTRWWRAWRQRQKVLALENRLEVQQRLVAQLAGGESTRAAKPLSLLRLWMQPASEAHITFSVLPDRLLAITRTRGSASVATLPISKIELRAAVKARHAQLMAVRPRRGENALGRSLAALLEKLPARVSELCLRPDDALHGFPFAALLINDKPAIHRFSLSLRHPASSKSTRAPVRQASVVAVQEALGDYPRLPGAEAEMVRTSKQLKELGLSVYQLTGIEARKGTVVRELESSNLVHVACHGHFEPDKPSTTGLVLRGTSGEADTLSIAEISRLNCSRLEHITLTACWSADNFVVPGRWIFSLPETFCRAGAGSVLASLWEVRDDISPALMARFYGNLKTLTRAEALRECQIACAENRLLPGTITSDPIFWAGFYIFGENGRIVCN